MSSSKRIDKALERKWQDKQGREDREARAYVQRHGLRDVVDNMVDDAIKRHDKAWTRRGGKR